MASIFEIDNDTPLEHTCSNGVTFKTETADLRKGVTVSNRNGFMFEDAIKVGKDFAEFGAWHCLEIRPNLNGFAGYDAITYTIEQATKPTREELLGLPPKDVVDTNMPELERNCNNCGHRDGVRCVRTGFQCSTEVSHGGECAKGSKLKLWIPRRD